MSRRGRKGAERSSWGSVVLKGVQSIMLPFEEGENCWKRNTWGSVDRTRWRNHAEYLDVAKGVSLIMDPS